VIVFRMTTLTPTLEGYLGTTTEARYQLLAQQAIEALHGHSSTPYHELEIDASQLARPLADALEERMEETITISKDDAKTLREYQSPYRYADILRGFMADPTDARRHHLTFLSRGVDVFASFEGRWRGTWFYHHREVAAFDHHWQPTQPASIDPSALLQPVVMGRISASQLATPAKPIGSDSDEPTPAVDAVSTKTGWIIGGVGFDEETQYTARPHVGYLASLDLLVWVARESTQRYSCFFERRYPDQSYRIVGAQFLWENHELQFEAFMGGVYQDPTSI
jgi:hypothetical protein